MHEDGSEVEEVVRPFGAAEGRVAAGWICVGAGPMVKTKLIKLASEAARGSKRSWD